MCADYSKRVYGYGDGGQSIEIDKPAEYWRDDPRLALEEIMTLLNRQGNNEK